jgi:putative glutamine amidotransferase
MAQPLIGITTYGRGDVSRFSLPAAYVDAVRRAGGIPVLVPPGEINLPVLVGSVSAMILTGGGDIDPNHYGGLSHAAIYGVDAERDAMELALARLLAAVKRPTLGICRGIQTINVALGGTLIEHLPDVVGDQIEHRHPVRRIIEHPVHVEPGSRLAAVLGQLAFPVVSWHHQAIRQTAPSLRAVGWAPDGTVEAVEMPEHPWLIAVQWHPELTAGNDALQQRLFDGLVQAARQ